MNASLPFELVIAWAFFVGGVNSHQRHMTHFRGSSRAFGFALTISTLLGVITGLGLLIFYFSKVEWYWPLALLAASALIGATIFGILDGWLGSLQVSLVSFICWPLCAVWIYYILKALPL
jgi:hypothetical protein